MSSLDIVQIYNNLFQDVRNETFIFTTDSGCEFPLVPSHSAGIGEGDLFNSLRSTECHNNDQEA